MGRWGHRLQVQNDGYQLINVGQDRLRVANTMEAVVEEAALSVPVLNQDVISLNESSKQERAPNETLVLDRGTHGLAASAACRLWTDSNTRAR